MMSLNHNSIPPGQFNDMCSPAWARVYIELSHVRTGKDRLAWQSESVKQWFTRLTGFDPVKAQYADIDGQHAALNAARELELSLHEADEEAQLDGIDALYYASGWMSARDWISGAKVGELDEEGAGIIAERYARAHFSEAEKMGAESYSGQLKSFFDGFKSRLKRGVNFVP